MAKSAGKEKKIEIEDDMSKSEAGGGKGGKKQGNVFSVNHQTEESKENTEIDPQAMGNSASPRQVGRNLSYPRGQGEAAQNPSELFLTNTEVSGKSSEIEEELRKKSTHNWSKLMEEFDKNMQSSLYDSWVFRNTFSPMFQGDQPTPTREQAKQMAAMAKNGKKGGKGGKERGKEGEAGGGKKYYTKTTYKGIHFH